MGYRYVTAREGVTPVAGDELLALTAATDKMARVREVAVMGEATASGVNRMAVRRSTTNAITPTAQTPAKISPTSPAAAITAATTHTTQPVTAAAPALWTYALNAFGGIVRWVAAPEDEMWIEGGTAGNNEVSLESSSGTNLVSCQMIHEEM
jgi:hypothetical protein